MGFLGFLPCSDVMAEQSDSFYESVHSCVDWEQPPGAMGPTPRKSAWMVRDGCTCAMSIGRSRELQPQPFPMWMMEIMHCVMPMCGVVDEQEWPDSCNLMLFQDGNDSVGWHAEDEKLFQAKFRDARFITLTLGARRKFEFRLNWPEDGKHQSHQLQMGNGDMLVMEGMLQKHFQNRVPKAGSISAPTVSLCWRWILKHHPKCPK